MIIRIIAIIAIIVGIIQLSILLKELYEMG